MYGVLLSYEPYKDNQSMKPIIGNGTSNIGNIEDITTCITVYYSKEKNLDIAIRVFNHSTMV